MKASESSRAGIPRVGFLETNSVIKDQKSVLEMANGHKAGPRASTIPRIWHAPAYHILQGVSMPKGTHFVLKSTVLKVHNPINRGPYSTFNDFLLLG